MDFYIDSANINEIKHAIGYGILNGCTTNPSLIARTKLVTGKKFIPIVKEICTELGGVDTQPPPASESYQETQELPVSIEVLSTESDKMVTEGKELAQIATNVVVKLPCTIDGLKACYELSTQDIPVNMTLCFSPMQALLCAKAGAAYVSPFVGRLDDVGEHGMGLVANIKMIFNNYRIKTKILVASIRNTNHILDAARIGADICTIPFGVINTLMEHHLTTKGLEIFLNDAKNANTKKD